MIWAAAGRSSRRSGRSAQRMRGHVDRRVERTHQVVADAAREPGADEPLVGGGRGGEQGLAFDPLVVRMALGVLDDRLHQPLLEALPAEAAGREHRADDRAAGVDHRIAVGHRAHAVVEDEAGEGAALHAAGHRGGHVAVVPQQLARPVVRLLLEEGPQLAGRDLTERAHPHAGGVSSPRPGTAGGGPPPAAARPRNSSPARYRGAASGAAPSTYDSATLTLASRRRAADLHREIEDRAVVEQRSALHEAPGEAQVQDGDGMGDPPGQPSGEAHREPRGAAALARLRGTSDHHVDTALILVRYPGGH